MVVSMKKITLGLLVSLSMMSVSVFAASAGDGNTQSTVNELLNQEMASSPAAPSDGQLNMQQIKSILQQQKKLTGSSKSTSGMVAALQDSALGDTGMSQQAFANMVRSLMPLSPDQIRTLRQLFDRSQKAAATSPGTPPRPTSTTIMVNLAPGATPPVIRLSNSFVSSLVFLDSTGQPWPIQAYDIGDPGSFNVQWNRSGNTLLVQPTTTYKSGNIAVMLKGKDTPIMVTLVPGQHAVDYRADLRVPGMGPNAKPTTSSLPSVANPSLLTFLNGVPPQGAKRMQVTGGPAQAWLYKGKVYLRTSLTLLSPSWMSSMSSPDGTHIYEITKTPIVLASYQGQMVQLKVQEAK
jgi:intracellular multiplication protein IcmK